MWYFSKFPNEKYLSHVNLPSRIPTLSPLNGSVVKLVYPAQGQARGYGRITQFCPLPFWGHYSHVVTVANSMDRIFKHKVPNESNHRRGSASGRLPTGGGRGGRDWPLLVVWDRFVLRSRSSSGLSLFHQSLPKVRQLAVVPVRATTGLTSTCLLVVR